MALDTNINRIRFLRSEYSGRIPSPNLLEQGELAINLADRTIYSKKGNGDVVDLGFGKGGDVVGAINQTAGGFTTTGTVKAPQFEGALTGNASTASKLQTARTITIQGDAEGSISFDGSVSPNMQLRTNNLSPLTTAMGAAATALDYKQGLSNAFVRNDSGGGGWPMAYAGLINFRPYVNAGGALQILTAYGAAYGRNRIKLRIGEMNNGQFGEWEDLITDKYIGTYAPTLTGIGATGTWGINITGTSPQLTNPRNINGTAFNGTGDITINEPTFARGLSAYMSSDANTIAESAGVQWRHVNSSASNRPTGVTDGPVMSMAYSAVWNFQLMGDHRTGEIHTRGKNNGTWNSWKLGITNENIGNHALPITGGTVNGDLNVAGNIASTIGVIGTEKGFSSTNQRTVKPENLTARTFNVHFVGLAGLNSSDPGTIYGDFMTFNTWAGSSGGKVNGLFFAKGSKRIKHYQASHNDTVWGSPEDIAYLSDNVASATKLQTPRLINDVAFDGTQNIDVPSKYRGTITNQTQLDNAKLEGKYLVSNFSINGMYNYGILVVTTVESGAVINQVYYAHNKSGTNAIQMAQRMTFDNGVTWGTWLSIGEFDSTKLPLTGGTLSGNLDINADLSANHIKAKGVIGVDFINPSAPGSYLSWDANNGYTQFINHKMNGVGGFKWHSGVQNAYTELMNLTNVNNGTLTVNHIIGNASSATTAATSNVAIKLQTPRTINGTNFDGSGNIVTNIWGATRAITIGNTKKSTNGSADISYSLNEIGAVSKSGDSITGDLTVSGNLKGNTVTNRHGLDDKMYWSGAIMRPTAENVLITPIDANTFTAYFTLGSGSLYFNYGVSKLHLVNGWDAATPIFLDGIITKSVDANAGKQVITVTCTSPNHGISVPTNWLLAAITYEAYGCKYNGWVSGGDLRYQMRIKSDTPFVLKAPIVSSSYSSSSWYSGTQSGTGNPLPGVQPSTMIGVSVVPVDNEHIGIIGGGGQPLPFVSVVVKDKV